GEVVGVAGVVGSGQLDLIQAVAGLQTPRTGRVLVDGIDITGQPGRARAAGVAYVPEDRAAEGLALGLPVATNAAAKDLWAMGSWRGIDRSALAAKSRQVMAHLNVTPAVSTAPVDSLSGGIRQRLLAGRELVGTPAVVLAGEPTRGLDPGARVAVA